MSNIPVLDKLSSSFALFNNNSNLINTGLPWTNPLKLQIGSDEHVIDTTINRGLMMLLNNDYYLDFKNNFISNELSSLLDVAGSIYDILSEHISDNSIHNNVNLSTTVVEEYNTIVNENIYVGGNADQNINVNKLSKNTIKYIPISYNAVQIQQIINETPHDLNGFNLMFKFVIPSGFRESNNVSISRKF